MEALRIHFGEPQPEPQHHDLGRRVGKRRAVGCGQLGPYRFTRSRDNYRTNVAITGSGQALVMIEYCLQVGTNSLDLEFAFFQLAQTFSLYVQFRRTWRCISSWPLIPHLLFPSLQSTGSMSRDQLSSRKIKGSLPRPYGVIGLLCSRRYWLELLCPRETAHYTMGPAGKITPAKTLLDMDSGLLV